MISRSYFPKLFSKAPLQSGCPKATMLQTYSPKLFSKATPESCSPKLLPPKLSFFKATVRQCCFQRRKVVPRSCSPKLLFKVATESRVRKTFPKTPRLLPEAASKLVRKAVQSCSPKLLPKAVPRRCSPKLCPKAVLQSCCPKAAILQTCSPKRLPKAILQSGS